MRYIVKYHNFPITWEVEAIDEADAVKKGLAEMRRDMEQSSCAAGGAVEVKVLGGVNRGN